VVLVALQGQVPVLGADEPDQGLAVPPALSVKTERHATPDTQILMIRDVVNDKISD